MNELKIDRNIARYVSLGLGFVGIVVMAVAFVLGSFKFENQWSYVGLGVAALGAAGFILLDPQALVKTATGRAGQYGFISVLVTIAFIAFVTIAFWVIKTINPQAIDLTELRKYELSDQSKQIMATLPEEVHAVGYFVDQQKSQQDEADLWLRQYAQASNGKFTYEFINPDRNPLAAQDTRSGTVVFTRGDQKSEASFMDEESMTTALVRLLAGKARIAYLITGHGERSTDDFSERGLSQIGQVMGNANVTLTPLNIFEQGNIPEDADLIIVAGPTSQFAPSEVEAISAYLDAGKAAFFMFDPVVESGAFSFGVLSADISPDGSRIVTGGADSTARIWDAAGQQVAILRGHTGAVSDVVFSPDGRQVATTGLDNTVRVWNADTGEQIAQLEGTISNVSRMAYSPDGQYLASVGTDMNLNVWSTANNQPMSYSPVTLTVPLLTLTFSPDNTQIAVSGGGAALGVEGASTTVFLRDAATGAEVQSKTLPTNSVVGLAYAADGATIRYATYDGTLGSMDVATGEARSETLYSAETGVSGFSVLADGNYAFSLGDGTIHIHPADATNTDGDTVLSEHTDTIWTVRSSLDGQSFVTASKDGSARLWTLGQTASTLQLLGHSESDKLLEYLATNWGVTVNDDIVIDLYAEQRLGSPYTLATFDASQFDSVSPITRTLTSKQIRFQIVRSISNAETSPEGVTLTQLVTSTPIQGATWGETQIPSNGQISQSDFNPLQDYPGPVTLGVSAENATTGGRIVVFGDTDFASDALTQNTRSGNTDLFANTVNWLSAKEDLITLPTTEIGTRTIDKPLNDLEVALLYAFSWCCLPGILLLTGVAVFLIRRRRR